jgi:hypothetical protein
MTIAKINETAGHGELDNTGEHLQRKIRLLDVAK